MDLCCVDTLNTTPSFTSLSLLSLSLCLTQHWWLCAIDFDRHLVESCVGLQSFLSLSVSSLFLSHLLSIYLSTCLSIYLSIYLAIYPSIHPSIIHLSFSHSLIPPLQTRTTLSPWWSSWVSRLRAFCCLWFGSCSIKSLVLCFFFFGMCWVSFSFILLLPYSSSSLFEIELLTLWSCTQAPGATCPQWCKSGWTRSSQFALHAVHALRACHLRKAAGTPYPQTIQYPASTTQTQGHHSTSAKPQALRVCTVHCALRVVHSPEQKCTINQSTLLGVHILSCLYRM